MAELWPLNWNDAGYVEWTTAKKGSGTTDQGNCLFNNASGVGWGSVFKNDQGKDIRLNTVKAKMGTFGSTTYNFIYINITTGVKQVIAAGYGVPKFVSGVAQDVTHNTSIVVPAGHSFVLGCEMYPSAVNYTNCPRIAERKWGTVKNRMYCFKNNTWFLKQDFKYWQQQIPYIWVSDWTPNAIKPTVSTTSVTFNQGDSTTVTCSNWQAGFDYTKSGDFTVTRNNGTFTISSPEYYSSDRTGSITISGIGGTSTTVSLKSIHPAITASINKTVLRPTETATLTVSTQGKITGFNCTIEGNTIAGTTSDTYLEPVTISGANTYQLKACSRKDFIDLYDSDYKFVNNPHPVTFKFTCSNTAVSTTISAVSVDMKHWTPDDIVVNQTDESIFISNTLAEPTNLTVTGHPAHIDIPSQEYKVCEGTFETKVSFRPNLSDFDFEDASLVSLRNSFLLEIPTIIANKTLNSIELTAISAINDYTFGICCFDADKAYISDSHKTITISNSTITNYLINDSTIINTINSLSVSAEYLCLYISYLDNTTTEYIDTLDSITFTFDDSTDTTETNLSVNAVLDLQSDIKVFDKDFLDEVEVDGGINTITNLALTCNNPFDFDDSPDEYNLFNKTIDSYAQSNTIDISAEEKLTLIYTLPDNPYVETLVIYGTPHSKIKVYWDDFINAKTLTNLPEFPANCYLGILEKRVDEIRIELDNSTELATQQFDLEEVQIWGMTVNNIQLLANPTIRFNVTDPNAHFCSCYNVYDELPAGFKAKTISRSYLSDAISIKDFNDLDDTQYTDNYASMCHIDNIDYTVTLEPGNDPTYYECEFSAIDISVYTEYSLTIKYVINNANSSIHEFRLICPYGSPVDTFYIVDSTSSESKNYIRDPKYKYNASNSVTLKNISPNSLTYELIAEEKHDSNTRLTSVQSHNIGLDNISSIAPETLILNAEKNIYLEYLDPYGKVPDSSGYFSYLDYANNNKDIIAYYDITMQIACDKAINKSTSVKYYLEKKWQCLRPLPLSGNTNLEFPIVTFGTTRIFCYPLFIQNPALFARNLPDQTIEFSLEYNGTTISSGEIAVEYETQDWTSKTLLILPLISSDTEFIDNTITLTFEGTYRKNSSEEKTATLSKSIKITEYPEYKVNTNNYFGKFITEPVNFEENVSYKSIDAAWNTVSLARDILRQYSYNITNESEKIDLFGPDKELSSTSLKDLLITILSRFNQFAIDFNSVDICLADFRNTANHAFQLLKSSRDSYKLNTPRIAIATGEYFMADDNRDFLADGRLNTFKHLRTVEFSTATASPFFEVYKSLEFFSKPDRTDPTYQYKFTDANGTTTTEITEINVVQNNN